MGETPTSPRLVAAAAKTNAIAPVAPKNQSKDAKPAPKPVAAGKTPASTQVAPTPAPAVAPTLKASKKDHVAAKPAPTPKIQTSKAKPAAAVVGKKIGKIA